MMDKLINDEHLWVFGRGPRLKSTLQTTNSWGIQWSQRILEGWLARENVCWFEKRINTSSDRKIVWLEMSFECPLSEVKT